MRKNGLELKRIESTCNFVKPLGDIKQMVSQYITERAYAVIYLDYKILIGTFRDAMFHTYNNEPLEDRYIQRLRVFDDKKELYIWRTEDGFKGRLRIDGQGDETHVVDASSVLFGTRIAETHDSGYSILTEDRGTELIVPMIGLKIDNQRNRLFLRSRNYIGYTPTHQAGYVDCRFISITNSIDKAQGAA